MSLHLTQATVDVATKWVCINIHYRTNELDVERKLWNRKIRIMVARRDDSHCYDMDTATLRKALLSPNGLEHCL
jgi:hypothetical protein